MNCQHVVAPLGPARRARRSLPSAQVAATQSTAQPVRLFAKQRTPLDGGVLLADCLAATRAAYQDAATKGRLCSR
jgi:hypothetical protein